MLRDQMDPEFEIHEALRFAIKFASATPGPIDICKQHEPHAGHDVTRNTTLRQSVPSGNRGSKSVACTREKVPSPGNLSCLTSHASRKWVNLENA